MSIIDSRTEFCVDEPAFGAAATRLEGNQIDLSHPRDIGQGTPLIATIVISTTFVGAGASVDFQIASDSTAAIATNGSATSHGSTGPIPVAELVAGARFEIKLPAEGREYERYLGLLVVTSGAATTAGAIDAFISLTSQMKTKAYPAAA